MTTRELVMVDTNVPMYASGGEHPYREPCARVMRHISDRAVNATTDTEVHQEILHRYLSIGRSARARALSEDFQTMVPDPLPVTMHDIVRARELSSKYTGLPARDLLHVAVMLNHGIRVILSTDRHFDQVAEIERLDPLTLAQTT